MVYSLLTIIPLGIVSSVFYNKSILILETRIRESNSQTLVNVVDKIDEQLKTIESIAMTVTNDPVVYPAVRNDSEKRREPQTADTLDNMRIALAEIAKQSEFIDSIYVFNKYNQGYSSSKEFNVQGSVSRCHDQENLER